jgi:hypothetical protein
MEFCGQKPVTWTLKVDDYGQLKIHTQLKWNSSEILWT